MKSEQNKATNNSKSISTLIANDTLLDSMDKHELCKSLKHVTLNLNDSIYILQKAHEKYKLSDRIKVINHMTINFGEADKIDINDFTIYLTVFGKCLEITIIQPMVKIIKSIHAKINNKSNVMAEFGTPSGNQSKYASNPFEPVTKSSVDPFATPMTKEVPENFDPFGPQQKEQKKEEKVNSEPIPNAFFAPVPTNMPISQPFVRKESNPNIIGCMQAIQGAFNPWENNSDVDAFAVRKAMRRYSCMSECAEISRNFMAFNPWGNSSDVDTFAVRRAMRRYSCISECSESSQRIEKVSSTDSVSKADINPFQQESSQETVIVRPKLTEEQLKNENIVYLYETQKTAEKFERIYNIFDRIAEMDDKEALKYGINEQYCHITNEFGKDIMLYAASNDNFKLVQLLVKSGVEYSHRDKEGKTPFFWFCSKGDKEAVEFFLELPYIDVNSPTNTKFTTLMTASSCGHSDIVKVLSKVKEIDVNAKDKFGYTALMNASTMGHKDIVKMLLRVDGIDINAKDLSDKTALNLASLYDHNDIVKILEKALQD